MGGKKKTKWRKLPLGELTQRDDARGSTNSGSLREQTDHFKENGTSNDYDNLTNDEHAWKETRHRGYYNVGPPHFYSINTVEGQDGLNEGGTGENDEKPGIFFNGFWSPESDLDQYNSINEPPMYEPFCRQIPVFLCPPMLPYCSTPYPNYRPGHSSDTPLFPHFGIPSDPHYYYYLTRPQTEDNEGDHTFGEKEENISKPTSGRGMSENQQLTQPEPNCDGADQDQAIPLTPETNTDSTVLYPYPGYSFGEPVYSVPIYPILPPTQRIIPRFSWPSAQTQRKRRRRRKEYNADYAVIPAVKNSSLRSTGATATKSSGGDLDAERDTALNNESCNQQQQKEKAPHPLPATGNGSLSHVKEPKQYDCVLNNQEDKDTAESARLNHREKSLQCTKNLVAGITSTDNTEFPKRIDQETSCNSPLIQLCGETLSEIEEDLIHNILTDLILKVEEQVSEENPRIQNKLENGVNDETTEVENREINFSDSKNPSHTDSNSSRKKIRCNALNKRKESLERPVNSWDCEDRRERSKMENVLRKNPNPDFPEVHKKVQEDLRVENSDSYISPKNCQNNKISRDSYIQNENEKNLLICRTAELSINEENNFFSVSLDDAEADVEDFGGERESWVESGNLETPVHIVGEYESPIENEQQSEIQRHVFRVSEKSDSSNYTEDRERHHSPAKNNAENKGVGKFEECKADAGLVPKNHSVNDDDGCKGNIVEVKSYCGGDVSESAPSSNECSHDKDKQLYDSHRSSPHSFLSYVANSEALIRETELELSKIQHLTSRPPLQANQSIYKFAFDENLTDQSETEDTITPIPSPLLGLPSGQDRSGDSEDLAAISAEMRQDVQKSEIIVHEGDSGSEAGSEDVELIPHRYESQCGDKHLYVNKLSLAVELLRTHENLPYDDEFKRVVDDEMENSQCGNKGDEANSKSRSNKTTAYVSSGAINPAFIDDCNPKIHLPVQTSPQSSLRIVDHVNHPREGIDYDPEHRLSRISTADSGVQSEDSGDEICEEAKESVYGRLGFTESEEQELWNPVDDATVGYRRFGAQVRQRFNILNPRAGSLNPCFCCIIM